jgi:hypothetical protein
MKSERIKTCKFMPRRLAIGENNKIINNTKPNQFQALWNYMKKVKNCIYDEIRINSNSGNTSHLTDIFVSYKGRDIGLCIKS